MTERFPEQAKRYVTAPVLSGDAATDRWIWNLSMLLREIVQNPGEEAYNSSPEANYSSEIKGTDQAIWDRIKLVPFNARFEKGINAESDLKEKLLEEAEGILAWMIEGCREWQADGLPDCPTVKSATIEYRGQEDTFALFETEKLQYRLGAFTTTKDIFQKYNEWANDNGEKKMANASVAGTKMSDLGYKKITKNNQRGFIDVVII